MTSKELDRLFDGSIQEIIEVSKVIVTAREKKYLRERAKIQDEISILESQLSCNQK